VHTIFTPPKPVKRGAPCRLNHTHRGKKRNSFSARHHPKTVAGICSQCWKAHAPAKPSIWIGGMSTLRLRGLSFATQRTTRKIAASPYTRRSRKCSAGSRRSNASARYSRRQTAKPMPRRMGAAEARPGGTQRRCVPASSGCVSMTSATLSRRTLTSGMQPRFQKEQMGHERDGMYGRYAHVPRDELVKAVAAMPRLEFQELSYLEWARSGFGKQVAPAQPTGTPEQPATSRSGARRAKGEQAA